ncbi:hypothetical protein GCM10009557_91190 [Virgisporangium ochraceum]
MREADAIAKVGRAEAAAAAEHARVAADAVRDRMKAEAEGLTDKAPAMAALDENTREHEEYRLRLEQETKVRLAGIEVQRSVAESQARVLSAALENANVDIVGGDSQFFDKLVGAVSLGKSVDRFVDHSAVARSLAGPWLEGSANPVEDLAKLLGSVNSGDVSNAALSALLLQQMRHNGSEKAAA